MTDPTDTTTDLPPSDDAEPSVESTAVDAPSSLPSDADSTAGETSATETEPESEPEEAEPQVHGVDPTVTAPSDSTAAAGSTPEPGTSATPTPEPSSSDSESSTEPQVHENPEADPDQVTPEVVAPATTVDVQGNRVRSAAQQDPNNPVAIYEAKIVSFFEDNMKRVTDLRALLDEVEDALHKLRVGI